MEHFFRDHFGHFAALLTAIFWTVTALSFEAASRKIGSMIVNLLRLIVGFVFLSVFVFFYRGLLFPVDATPKEWFYLSLSGLIGFVFGDLCLFQAFVLVGARISMLIMALAPPITALIGWMILGESLEPRSWIGMALTIAGIALVVLKRQTDNEGNGNYRKVKFNYPVWGILLAFGGALGQGAGLVLSKYGMGGLETGAVGYDTFAATQIRVIAGIAGFSILFTFLGFWKEALRALTFRKPMLQLSLGAFFGPFLGVSFSLIAIEHADTGVAATIMAIVPVLIIPSSILLYKEKVTYKEVIGAILAVSGVGIFFL
jgi:drug/metabolite transporter (DMT)-like permease